MTGEITCYGKKSFPTYWAAKRSAKALNRYRDGAKANPYKCDHCRGFHVGNTMGHNKVHRPSRHTRKVMVKNGRKQFSK